MICLDYDWPTDNLSEWHELWFVGDQHWGSAGCAEDRVRENVREIAKNPRSRLCLMGDCCDFVTYSDKRFDLRQVNEKYIPLLDDLPKRVADDFIQVYEPVKKQIVALIPGNHEKTIHDRYHIDVAGYIAGCLGIPLLDTMSQLRVRLHAAQVGSKDRSFVVKGVLSHAKKGATTLGGKVTAASRIFDFFGDHDFIAQAHMHEYAALSVPTLDMWGSFGNPKVHHRERLLFLTGSYLKTYGPGSSYGEIRGYRPCRLGSPRLQMRMQRTTQTDASGEHKRDKPILQGL